VSGWAGSEARGHAVRRHREHALQEGLLGHFTEALHPRLHGKFASKPGSTHGRGGRKLATVDDLSKSQRAIHERGSTPDDHGSKDTMAHKALAHVIKHNGQVDHHELPGHSEEHSLQIGWRYMNAEMDYMPRTVGFEDGSHIAYDHDRKGKLWYADARRGKKDGPLTPERKKQLRAHLDETKALRAKYG